MKQREEGKEKVMGSFFFFHMGPMCRGLLREDLTTDGGPCCALGWRMGAGWGRSFEGSGRGRAACAWRGSKVEDSDLCCSGSFSSSLHLSLRLCQEVMDFETVNGPCGFCLGEKKRYVNLNRCFRWLHRTRPNSPPRHESPPCFNWSRTKWRQRAHRDLYINDHRL